MHIALVTHFFPAHGGGVEKVAAQLAARFAAHGHRVTWCASAGDAAPAIAGVSCEPMRGFNGIERATGFPYPLWSPASLRRLGAVVRAADAVHVHDCIYAGSLVAAWLARRHGKPLVATQHIGVVPLRPALRPVLAAANRLGAHAVLRPAEAVAFISPVVRRYFEALGVPRERCHDVPNGVDHAVFHADGQAPEHGRAALGLDAQRPLLLFVGRFVAKKRLPLVRAMAAARPDWQWCVIGQGPERPEAWGLPNVRVLPPMPQPALAAWYRSADLLVLPSHGEGFPLVVQEAMACGLPACITAEVAAGGALTAPLFIELPELPADAQASALGGVQAIAEWLARPAAQRTVQRAACAQFAALVWHWDAAADTHLRWLCGSRAS